MGFIQREIIFLQRVTTVHTADSVEVMRWTMKIRASTLWTVHEKLPIQIVRPYPFPIDYILPISLAASFAMAERSVCPLLTLAQCLIRRR